MLERRISQAGVVFYVSPLLERVGVPHGFSTRIGGVSMKPFDSLNLGNPQGALVQDEWERIHENYRRLQAAIGAPRSERVWVHQVHGGDVVVVRQGHQFTNAAKADALVSDDPQRLLTVRVADCVPILVTSADGGAVAAIHAGWRGVVGRVVSNALRELRRLTHEAVLAAVGPCISQQHFEVGSEVVEQFQRSFSDHDLVVATGTGKWHIDLRRAVQAQLLESGLTESQVDMTECCSYGDAEEFYSHRRDHGRTGRMAAMIAPARTSRAQVP